MPVDDEDAWFAPKRFGYGAGLPISRQGWALLAGYVFLILLAGLLIPYSPLGYGIIVVGATGAFAVLAARKTRGGWHWRWGKVTNGKRIAIALGISLPLIILGIALMVF